MPQRIPAIIKTIECNNNLFPNKESDESLPEYLGRIQFWEWKQSYKRTKLRLYDTHRELMAKLTVYSTPDIESIQDSEFDTLWEMIDVDSTCNLETADFEPLLNQSALK
jgi:hypothetical protein